MKKRIVVIGGGFGGMNLAKNLAGVKGIEVVLVDRNNYNYFPPLIYQVASSFIEPSNISYPFRKMFQGKDNVRFYQGTFLSVDVEQNSVQTSEGNLSYDYLVFAQGTQPNYFGLSSISEKALPLKNINDALKIRNTILNNMEQACKTSDAAERRKLMTFVIAGGGPTGVELSGMLSEMNRNIRKKDYPELANDPMHVYLVDAAHTSVFTKRHSYRQTIR
jgi:NADH dehydrogenase